MDPIDILMVLMRWLHLTSAAVWIGGSIFFILVVQSKTNDSKKFAKISKFGILSEFSSLSDILISTLLLSGMILTVNRLTIGTISSLYLSILSFKIILSLWLFLIVWFQRGFRKNVIDSTPLPAENDPITVSKKIRDFFGSHKAIVPVGLIIFLVSDALKIISEKF
tara:strand:+ start:571 stop:1068 length:498 start_codon:yes stop_codon:yes gene_type:complete